MQMIFGHDEAIARWVASRLPHRPYNPIGQVPGYETPFGMCRAIGISAGHEADSPFYAGVVYHNMIEQIPGHLICEVSIAAVSPRWAKRGIIRALLSYPFEQLKVKKLYSIMMQDNDRAVRFNLGIGFKKEANLRHHFGKGKHAVITSMLSGEYQHIYGEGKVLTGRRDQKIVKFPACDPVQLPA